MTTLLRTATVLLALILLPMFSLPAAHTAIAQERGSSERIAPASAEADRKYRELMSRGAKRVPASQIRREALGAGGGGAVRQHTCGAVACWCEGALNCLDMLSSCGGDYLNCLPGPNGPVCVCTQN